MKLSYLLGILFFMGNQALAHDVGNGGGAWVCRDTSSKIVKAELVDLFEARNEFSLKAVTVSPETVTNYLELVRQKIQAGRVAQIDSYDKTLAQIQDQVHPIGAEAVLEVIDDALYRLKPSPHFCPPGASAQYEQVANFTHDVPESILLNQEIFNALNPVNQAAIFVHEAVYKLLRDEGHIADSVKARRIVGVLFSEVDPKTYIEDFRVGKSWPCGLSGTVKERITDCSKSVMTTSNDGLIHRTWDLLYRGELPIQNDLGVKPVVTIFRNRKTGLTYAPFTASLLKVGVWGSTSRTSLSWEYANTVCSDANNPIFRTLKGSFDRNLVWALPSITEYGFLYESGQNQENISVSATFLKEPVVVRGNQHSFYYAFTYHRNSKGEPGAFGSDDFFQSSDSKTAELAKGGFGDETLFTASICVATTQLNDR